LNFLKGVGSDDPIYVLSETAVLPQVRVASLFSARLGNIPHARDDHALARRIEEKHFRIKLRPRRKDIRLA